MGEPVDLFERRNRARIAALVVLATLNYIVAVVMAAIALGIGLALAILFEGDAFPSDADSALILAIAIGVVTVGSIVIGIVVGVARIPFLRRRLERQMLKEPGPASSSLASTARFRIS